MGGESEVAELVDVIRDSVLVASLGFLRDSLGHDSTSSGMILSSTNGQGVGSSVHHWCISLRLEELWCGSETVNVTKAFGSVEHQSIRAISNIVAYDS